MEEGDHVAPLVRKWKGGRATTGHLYSQETEIDEVDHVAPLVRKRKRIRATTWHLEER